mgnify:CR=1 FL=1
MFICKQIKQWDATRLVNNASGWTDRQVGDVHDIHSYPGPGTTPVEEDRAVVLGEFGGLGLPISGHTWQQEKNWGYRSFENREALNDGYVALLTKLRPLVGCGLSAAVYTQTILAPLATSTLFIKQHWVVDVVAGSLMAVAACAVFFRGRTREAIPEAERGPAPALALVVAGVVGAVAAVYWVLYRFFPAAVF